MSFYMKRTYVDHEPGIELINIHYTWTPLGELPNWEAHRETRAIPILSIIYATGCKQPLTRIA